MTFNIYSVKIPMMFMKKVGIVCEYNPFHNGHIYHLKKIKELFPDSLIILVMSGNFTMRGELSLLDKWDKTSISLKYGVDLVIELPLFYSINSSDIFAEGSIKLLNYLKCDYIVFGSESNDIDKLTLLANTQINNEKFDNLVKDYLDTGLNYPTSLAKALEDICHTKVNSPNDLLGISYIKEIIKNNYNIKPVTILRTNNYHDKEINNNISSATSIRETIKNKGNIINAVPKETNKLIIKDNFDDNYFKILKYKILSDIDNLNTYLDVSEGIDNLIKKNIIKSNNLEELINNIKTKRYTYNRIKRMLLHILLNIKKEDKRLKEINYIRLLGFSKKGRNYIKEIKKDSIPIITNYSDLNDSNLNTELYSSIIYYQIINKDNLYIKELKSIPIIKE